MNNPASDDRLREDTVQRLVRDEGLTEAYARFLVGMLGTAWSSLMREVQLMKKKHL